MDAAIWVGFERRKDWLYEIQSFTLREGQLKTMQNASLELKGLEFLLRSQEFLTHVRPVPEFPNLRHASIAVCQLVHVVLRHFGA